MGWLNSNANHKVPAIAGFMPRAGVGATLSVTAVHTLKKAVMCFLSAIPEFGNTSEPKSLKRLKMKGIAALTGKTKTGAAILEFINNKSFFMIMRLKLKDFCLIGKCFTGDTLVCTKRGYIPIKEVTVSDQVYSRNEITGENGFKKVEQTAGTKAHTIYTIELDKNTVINTTAYHPFYSEKRGWVSAINLRTGDRLVASEGVVLVTSIEKIRLEEPVKMYNLHVEDWVSYFVSELNVYVHNGGRHKGYAGSGDTININGVVYTDGEPVCQDIEFDNDYPYDPNFKPVLDDYKNWVIWRTKLSGAEFLQYLPDGCKAYRHYTDGKGKDLRIDYEKAYRQDEGVKNSVDNKLNEGISAAVEYYNSSGKSSFSLTGGPTTSTDYPTTENWQKAIGGHTQWNSMDVTVKDKKMVIEIAVHELDRYNFDKDKQDIATGTLDDVNGRFASAGWAHSFTSEGEIKRTITIDLNGDLTGIHSKTEGVKIESERKAKYGKPWEGKER